MAQFVEEGQTEGNETAPSKPALTLEQWLKKNRLKKLAPYFEDEEVVLDDLKTYSEAVIEKLWEYEAVKSLKLGPLYKERFVQAVRKLQYESEPHAVGTTNAGVFGQIHRIVISSEEQDCINRLESQRDAIISAVKQIESKQQSNLQMQKRAESEMHSFFKSIQQQLDERYLKLKEEFADKVKTQGADVDAQVSNLQKHQQSIIEALDKENALILNPKISGDQRQNNIKDITTTVLQSVNLKAMTFNPQPVQFTKDDKAVSEFISAIGRVSGKPDPPTIAISKISACGATVRFQSEHKSDDVVYSLHYRRMTGDNDDEKENEWKEKVMMKGVNTYALSGLSRNTQYQLYGRYKVLEDMIWSEPSILTSMTTKKVDNPKFEWDPARKHADIQLLNGKKTLKQTVESDRVAIAKSKLSSDTMNAANLEFQFTDIMSEEMDFVIGFVHGSAVGKVRIADQFGAKAKECGIYIHEDEFKVRGGTKNNHQFDAKWKGSNVKNRDRILLSFDFLQSKCSVSFNDEKIGIIADSLPKEVYVVASLYSQLSIKSTKFEVVPKV